MALKTVKVEQHLHYVEDGELCGEYWLACHGYGQLPEFFAKPFSAENIHIVAPEAPNTFYLEGFSGRVGANWMTKHHRECDVENYLGFLNEIVKKTLMGDKERRVLFGFSQGVHTISRFFLQSAVEWDALVLCGAAMPDDVLAKLTQGRLGQTKLIIATSPEDQFLNERRTQDYLSQLNVRGVSFTHVIYNGGHKVNAELISQLRVKLA